MPKGYVIAQINVTDPVRYPDYVAKVLPTIEAFGGQFLVRGGEAEHHEGSPVGERFVVIEFPNISAAKDWYASDLYAPVRSMRMACSNSVQTIVEGV